MSNWVNTNASSGYSSPVTGRFIDLEYESIRDTKTVYLSISLSEGCSSTYPFDPANLSLYDFDGILQTFDNEVLTTFDDEILYTF